jgi:hypothetical protein
MAYAFGGMLYRNSKQMHVAIAENWLCADGLNCRKDMLNVLSSASDEALADELIEVWISGEDEEVSREEMVDAFREIRENFDAHFPPEERG